MTEILAFNSWQGQRFFFLQSLKQSQDMPSLLSDGCWELFSPVIRQLECEGDHSRPSNAEVNVWICASVS
jgi:hypothetical protein